MLTACGMLQVTAGPAPFEYIDPVDVPVAYTPGENDFCTVYAPGAGGAVNGKLLSGCPAVPTVFTGFYVAGPNVGSDGVFAMCTTPLAAPVPFAGPVFLQFQDNAPALTRTPGVGCGGGYAGGSCWTTAGIPTSDVGGPIPLLGVQKLTVSEQGFVDVTQTINNFGPNFNAQALDIKQIDCPDTPSLTQCSWTYDTDVTEVDVVGGVQYYEKDDTDLDGYCDPPKVAWFVGPGAFGVHSQIAVGALPAGPFGPLTPGDCIVADSTPGVLNEIGIKKVIDLSAAYDADNTEDGDDDSDQGAPASNQCGDGSDNDTDGLTDADDPDCHDFPETVIDLSQADLHCLGPSFHTFEITDTISVLPEVISGFPVDVEEPNTANNTDSTAVTVACVADAAVSVDSVTIMGVDIDGDTDVDYPTPSNGLDDDFDGDTDEEPLINGIDEDGDQHEDGTVGLPGDFECNDLIDNDGVGGIDQADANCQAGPAVDEDTLAIESDDGFDQDVSGVPDEDPQGDCDDDGDPDDDGDTLIDEDGGQCLILVIEKDITNAGPFSPVTVAIVDLGTGIAPTGLPGPAGAVPADCTLLHVDGPSSVSLPLGTTTVTEKYALHCNFSPFTNINDDPDATPDPLGGDKDVDEDPVDGTSQDVYHAEFSEDGFPFPGSCADGIDNGAVDGADAADLSLDCVEQGGVADIDEDPSFEVAAFAFVETAAQTNQHIEDDTGDNTNLTTGAMPAIPPQTPSAIDIIDEGNLPGAVGTTFVLPGGSPPLDDDCLITQSCEMEWYYNQPGGNPTQGSRLTVDNADGAFGGLGFDIANSFTGLTGDGIPGFGAAEVFGAGISNGSTVARATFGIRLGFAPQCVQPGTSAPIGGGLTLKDGALPAAGSTLSTYPEGPTFPSSGITGVSDGTSTNLTVDTPARSPPTPHSPAATCPACWSWLTTAPSRTASLRRPRPSPATPPLP